jgi:hypothetical protein
MWAGHGRRNPCSQNFEFYSRSSISVGVLIVGLAAFSPESPWGSMPDDTTIERPGLANIAEAKSRRRSERVVLRVSLLLSAMMPDDRQINIEAQSLVVNAHGGLLRVGMEMSRGQKIYLRNIKTELSTSARVLRVEGLDEGHFSVAFEFESVCPQFWPVSFPPSDWSIACQ